MRVDLIACTKAFDDVISAAVGEFERDLETHPGEHLIETAGRLCYMSFGRPNPKTAKNADYIRHILEVGHLSVLEHVLVTFLIQGVSRSLTHELVRHRHLSFSQLSQRYVDESDTEFVVPPLVTEAGLEDLFKCMTDNALAEYQTLVEELTRKFPDAKRKEIRQAARAVLPNATETKIVVSGNLRAWRHFIDIRATEHADAEIRALAVECLRQLQTELPSVFADYEISELADGAEVASSAFGEVS